MRLLLDTHVVLWWLNDSPQLGQTARDAIAAPANMVYVSAVSVWETVLKHSLGKLEIPDNWTEVLADEPFLQLSVTWAHTIGVGQLPDLHRDPFDRLLLAQAIAENLTIVTHDETIFRYPVPVLRT